MGLSWERVSPGHYMGGQFIGQLEERFEVIRTVDGWELTDRYTGNVAVTPTLKAAKAAAEIS